MEIVTDQIYLYWLVGGALLIVLEFFIPGAVVIFFGLGALITGLVVYLDLISELYVQFLFWIAASMGLTLLLRQQIMRIFPPIEKDDFVDENEELKGKQVLVLETIRPSSDEGRIRYQGTSYKARSVDREIPKGEMAEIVERNNLLFVVKKPS